MPHPQAVLAAILAKRGSDLGPYQIAVLCADIARLGKTATRHAVAWCNGETFPGQRKAMERLPQDEYSKRSAVIEQAIERQGERISTAAERLRQRLEPFGLGLSCFGDPRGHVVKIYELTTPDHTLWSI